MRPRRRSRWDDAVETAEDVRELVALIRLVIGAIATVIFLGAIFVIGAMYLVLGHTAGRVVGVGIVAFGVVLARASVRELREWASKELEDKTWDHPGNI